MNDEEESIAVEAARQGFAAGVLSASTGFAFLLLLFALFWGK